MKHLAANLATGALCRLNLALAAVGITGTLTLEDKARIFAALATGSWFSVQIVLALLDRVKRRRQRRP